MEVQQTASGVLVRTPAKLNLFLEVLGKRTDGFHELETLMTSIRQRILTLPDETVLYPGHGPETTVGHERATNPYLVPNLGGSSFA